MTAIRELKKFLALQEYHLSQEHAAWNNLVEKIHKNPNQMNVLGLWQQDQIQALNVIYCKVHCREHYVHELKAHIAQLSERKPRKRLRRK